MINNLNNLKREMNMLLSLENSSEKAYKLRVKRIESIVNSESYTQKHRFIHGYIGRNEIDILA